MSLWLQITAGRGPAECQWVVAQLLPLLQREAVAAGVTAEPIDAIPGESSGTLLSALVSLSGAAAEAFAASWQGSIQWIGKSPFRPHHKRQNWYVGVERLAEPTTPLWSLQELEFSTLRASGPGGQHVNKTESAVRVVHRPTGISVVAREERSQQQNKRLALARLAAMMAERGERARADADKQRWEQHNALERGNPTRVYAGADFRRRSAE
jgi:peptide chain release factor